MIVADYILARREIHMTPLQVNKLTYIAHGFNLAIYDKKLVNESVEAWQFGPVFPSLYYALRDFGGSNIPSLLYCNTMVNDTELDNRVQFLKTVLGDHTHVIDLVMETYGKLTGSRLITLTHEKGTPWHKFYRKGRRGIVIPTQEIKTHYKDLINGNF